MNRRQLQLASTLQRTTQGVINRGLADPRVRGLITITKVEVSPDLRMATFLISVLPEDVEPLTMHGLRSAAKRIRHDVSDKIAMARTPEFRFKLDKTLKAQANVLHAIAKATAELDRDKNAASAGPEGTNEEPETGSDPEIVLKKIGQTSASRESIL